ncbi:hypothetical protein CHU93_15600 [Sandarakinorhabdus cyanobacteriorum]|uniref:Endonuclease GajA/Old nuclease/RecF-like AAA domain-containing protein n=1 Tax=Sandarakinorhabdus cyanobacteriorum TaxID=1981098 RepID=A0A255Y500_9SPHN|nr:hypothetical protein CHU93_15600 [Sandarakinorhabdus cyanobacteriorum]
MILATFSVENYRSITQSRKISLSNNTVLVGPNNEGKSNVLRALNLAMSTISRIAAIESRSIDPELASRTLASRRAMYDWSSPDYSPAG